MQVGIVTLDGQKIGVVNLDQGAASDTFTPDIEGYEAQGRADVHSVGSPSSDHTRPEHHHSGGGSPGSKSTQHAPSSPPKGETFKPSGSGSPFRQGTAETDRAITDASTTHRLDPNTMRAIASIESGMNPSSNANRSTQYKGLYQVGHEEWRRFGQGNIYSAQDNAMATGRMFETNRNQFHARFGRDPTDTEMYMMHQQGFGFYTRNAMTNISGNPYPGMHGPQTHDSFEAGWGREVARRKAGFAARNVAATPAPVFDPETMAP